MIKYNTMSLADVWTDSEEFKTEYKASAFYRVGERLYDGVEQVGGVTMPDNITLFFTMFYARYNDTPISNDNIDVFKLKVFTTIFEYGPIWQRKLEIQKAIRGLSEDDIRVGGKMIYNHALHDASAPSTDSLEETTYIDSQDTANNKKSKLSAYNELVMLLDDGISKEFLDKFKKLFKIVLATDRPLYVYEEEDD